MGDQPATAQGVRALDRRTLQHFLGRSDVFARHDGTWQPVRRPLTDRDLDAHLSGESVLGTYLLEDGTFTKIVVFDQDTEDPILAKQLATMIRIRGGIPVIEQSGSNRWHLWVLLTERRPAADMRRWAHGVLKAVGHPPKVEVFPKQDHTNDLGNLIRLPGKHPGTGRWSVLHTPVERTDPDRLIIPPAAPARTRRTAKQGHGPVARFLRGEVTPGERNTTIHAFATWCAWSVGLPDDLALHWTLRLNRALPEPLPPHEVERALRSAYDHPPEDT